MKKCSELPPALQFFLLTFAGWVNRRQQKVIDYLLEENRVLREQLAGRRLRLTNDQRRRLAAQGKLLGRAALRKFAGIFTPDTILLWYRQLYADSRIMPTTRPTSLASYLPRSPILWFGLLGREETTGLTNLWEESRCGRTIGFWSRPCGSD